MEKYKGFLYIRCEKCGKERGYCTKTYIARHYCECGHVTPLTGLVPMYVMHECGQRTCRHKTNITDKIFDVPCIKCQAPVTVEWDSKRWQYKTVE